MYVRSLRKTVVFSKYEKRYDYTWQGKGLILWSALYKGVNSGLERTLQCQGPEAGHTSQGTCCQCIAFRNLFVVCDVTGFFSSVHLKSNFILNQICDLIKQPPLLNILCIYSLKCELVIHISRSIFKLALDCVLRVNSNFMIIWHNLISLLSLFVSFVDGWFGWNSTSSLRTVLAHHDPSSLI